MGQRWLDGYSAAVEVYLLIQGKRHDIAQIGGGSFILRGEHSIAANTAATLVIVVDGIEERQQILICEDARPDEPVAFF
jgi:hypothetical protein